MALLGVYYLLGFFFFVSTLVTLLMNTTLPPKKFRQSYQACPVFIYKLSTPYLKHMYYHGYRLRLEPDRT